MRSLQWVAGVSVVLLVLLAMRSWACSSERTWECQAVQGGASMWPTTVLATGVYREAGQPRPRLCINPIIGILVNHTLPMGSRTAALEPKVAQDGLYTSNAFFAQLGLQAIGQMPESQGDGRQARLALTGLLPPCLRCARMPRLFEQGMVMSWSVLSA